MFAAGLITGVSYAQRSKAMSRKVKILTLTIFAGCVLLAVAVPIFIRSRSTSSREACLSNIRQIDEALKQWESASATNFPSGGFLQMEFYIDRLIHSQKESARLLICTTEGPHVLILEHQAGQIVLSILPEHNTWDNAEESRIREFFNRRNMTPFREIRSGNLAYDNALHGLEYQLSAGSKVISRLCESMFTELYGVTDKQGVSFTMVGL